MAARFSAAVPLTCEAKLKLRVCQPLAVVTVASVSTDTPASAAFSTFMRTGMPAAGDHTRAVMVVLPVAKPMRPMVLPAPVEMVVPAHSSAAALLTMRATLLAASVGSVTTLASSAPPKPAKVGAVPSKLMLVVVAAPPPPAAGAG